MSCEAGICQGCRTVTVDCACYPNATCNDGLSCQEDVCRSETTSPVGGADAGTQTTTGDAGDGADASGGNCPEANPSACSGATPYFNTQFCNCVACLDNSHCPSGRTCGGSGLCTAGNTSGACQTACDPNTPGVCGGTTPYCVNSCCTQCLGVSDGLRGESCVNGTCGQPPSCADDPTACPAGFDCQDGQCVLPGTGGGVLGESCAPQNHSTCADGVFCDPATSTCKTPGGDAGCGSCNPDCTCPGTATCDGFVCSCDSNDPFACGEGYICVVGTCLAFGM